MFIDQVRVVAQGGRGGDGCHSFSHEYRRRHATPSGGNGGEGGDVVLRADPNLHTLLDVHHRHHLAAEDGLHGHGNRQHGARGADLVIRVPMGTVVREAGTGWVLRDLARAGESVIVARGGRGGQGNARHRDATRGEPGEQRELELELKLLADVGLIGLPNAGKSSLLSAISSARSPVAPYPFTTTSPVLGVVTPVHDEDDRTWVACDIPGLIAGAAQGRGLGSAFLRHIERTRLLVCVLDIAGTEGRDPLDDLTTLERELAAHQPSLLGRPRCLAANKTDLPEAAHHLERLRRMIAEPVYPISCVTGEGLPGLVQTIHERLAELIP